MKRSHKIGLLILSLLPIIMLPFVIFWIIGGAIKFEEMGEPEAGVPFFVGSMVFWILLIGMISMIAWIIYLVHVIKNKDLDQTEKIVWILLFVFVSFIPQLVYFFMRIWPEDEPNQLQVHSQSNLTSHE